MQKIIQYLKDVQGEMMKVTWPTKNELFGGTVLVIIFSLLMAIFVKLCDWGVSSLVKLFMQANW
ncbi:MAG: preprotein translocase subunit SecE [Chitinispirillaceae bacterium]|nr:preprotein translocase subunit SecE [Chitinispirillaceae bacterium]